MELRNAVFFGIGNAEVFDNGFSFRHLLLFQFQCSTRIRQCGRQRKCPAVDHSAVPPTGREVVADCIFIDAVTAEDMRIIITEEAGETDALKVHIMRTFYDAFINKRTEDIIGKGIPGGEVILLYLSAVNGNAHKRDCKVWRIGIAVYSGLRQINIAAAFQSNFYTHFILSHPYSNRAQPHGRNWAPESIS